MTENTPELDVLIIGGGQAGLAMGSHLKETPFRFQIAERHPRVGDSWRNRYASLVLFTPRAYSALPGLPVPGNRTAPERPVPGERAAPASAPTSTSTTPTNHRERTPA